MRHKDGGDGWDGRWVIGMYAASYHKVVVVVRFWVDEDGYTQHNTGHGNCGRV